MELNNLTIDTPPRDAASIVLLRDGAQGLEVLLMRRHPDSNVLGGAYVFPGGKLERSDSSAPLLRSHLDTPPADLHASLGESGLAVEHAAGLYACAVREAFEESGLLFATRHGKPLTADECRSAIRTVRTGTPFETLLDTQDWLLTTQALVPWTRWITSRQPSLITRRFDTRFFLAAAPEGQQVRQDEHEMTEARWLTPRKALTEYRDHQIDMIPPQLIGLMHLLTLPDVASAMNQARSRRPPLMQSHALNFGNQRVLCYPGDPEHPIQTRALPAPTRLIWRDKRFQPPEGLDALLAA